MKDYTDPQQAYLDGNRRMAVGDALGAEECFWQAIALQPEHAGARANLGYLSDPRYGALLETTTYGFNNFFNGKVPTPGTFVRS